MVLLASQGGLPALNDKVKAHRAFKRCAAQIAHPKAACTSRGLAISTFVPIFVHIKPQVPVVDEDDFEKVGYKHEYVACA
jgi:hypothetical protein